MSTYFNWPRCLLVFPLAIIIFSTPSFQASAHGAGTTITLSVSKQPLEKVCKEIEKQSGYYSVYPKELSQKGYLITLDLHSVDFELALKKIFEGLPLTYQIIDKVVVINTAVKTGSENATRSTDEPGFKAQGVVVSETGQALIGATVTMKSTGRSALTNSKGEFSLLGVGENTVLIISYVGYNVQQVRVKDNAPLRIVLTKATNELDAAVIKGYYNTNNRLNTGNASVVKAEDLAKQPVTDPLMALEGRVPGLFIQQSSGVPGSYATVQLRGQNSLRAGYKPLTLNDPLYIVDGIPFSSESKTNDFIGGGIFGRPSNSTTPGYNQQGISPFNNLNMADIESITVLKDADATSIYGSRGGNGVILITTKKGRVGLTKFDLNLTNGVGKITRRLDLLNTQQYLQMRREAFANDGIPITPGEFDIDGTWDTTRYTDWQRVLIGGSSRFSNLSANLSGGNNNTQFLLGGGYGKQGTTFPGAYFDQKSYLSVHINHLYKNLKVDFSGSFTNDNNNMPSQNLGSYISLAPDAPALYDKNGNLNWAVKDGSATWQNPMSFTGQRSKAISNTFFGALNINYQLCKGLDVSIHSGYNYGQMNQNNLTPSTIVPPPYNSNPLIRSNNFAENKNTSWIIEPQVNYTAILSKGKLSSLLGATLQNSAGNSYAFVSNTFASDALIDNPLAAANTSLVQYSQNLYRYSGIFGRLNYSWEEKYVANLTVRRDGSSRFGPRKQFGNFGALGLAWIFTKEDWISKLFPFLSFGKFRASYGITGSDQIADYQYLSAYSANSSTYQGITSLSPVGIGNPYFQWEKIKKIEGSLDLGFFRDQLVLDISYYRNRTDNQLIPYQLPLITGFSSVQANLPALIENKGLELSIISTNSTTADFTWKSALNFSLPQTKLIAYPNIAKSAYSTTYAVGQSLFSRLVYAYSGIDPQTGVYTFSKKKGGGFPNFPNDNIWSKPIGQKFSGGLSNSFTYKTLQLDIFIQFVKQLGYNYVNQFSLPGIYGVNQMSIVLNRWQKPGDRVNVQKFSTNEADPYPQIGYEYLLKASDAIITDASFLRLKNVALSYQIPVKWVKILQMQQARISMQCQNLLTITKYLGLDPETGALNLPPMRMIVLSVNATF